MEGELQGMGRGSGREGQARGSGDKGQVSWLAGPHDSGIGEAALPFTACCPSPTPPPLAVQHSAPTAPRAVADLGVTSTTAPGAVQNAKPRTLLTQHPA
ncbi:hypothetical protein HaLaN_11291 [Haematococcus lacustris]|uniref:Uncharacterized protein n=1 Tax=Haematococcus lacustris TaxID=44745 RepID=A0A699YXW7_HAELA|nr:hypothetical protein HaLaN_11291 [Haematococcus lacustris]